MLDSIVIGPSPDLSREIQRLCSLSGDILVYRSLSGYGTRYEVVRLLNQLSPQVVFLEIGPSPEALRTVMEIRAVNPRTPIVGFARDCDSEQLQKLEDAGVSSVLLWPFTVSKFEHALVSAIEQQRTKDSASIFVFLPAKAGSGASTAALNVAGALAREYRQRVLLLDADLHSGVLALLVGSRPERSIVDALGSAHELDERLWNTLKVEVHGLDLLAAPQGPGSTRLSSRWDYLQLMGFARPRYDSIVVDLPEVVNDATEAVVAQADAIFVVCTPEIPSLSLARRRLSELRVRGADEERVGVVLNRYTNRAIKLREVQRILGCELKLALPNDYARVCKASLEAALLTEKSNLARAFADFARLLVKGQNKGNRGPEVTAGIPAFRWCAHSA